MSPAVESEETPNGPGLCDLSPMDILDTSPLESTESSQVTRESRIVNIQYLFFLRNLFNRKFA